MGKSPNGAGNQSEYGPSDSIYRPLLSGLVTTISNLAGGDAANLYIPDTELARFISDESTNPQIISTAADSFSTLLANRVADLKNQQDRLEAPTVQSNTPELLEERVPPFLVFVPTVKGENNLVNDGYIPSGTLQFENPKYAQAYYNALSGLKQEIEYCITETRKVRLSASTNLNNISRTILESVMRSVDSKFPTPLYIPKYSDLILGESFSWELLSGLKSDDPYTKLIISQLGVRGQLFLHIVNRGIAGTEAILKPRSQTNSENSFNGDEKKVIFFDLSRQPLIRSLGDRDIYSLGVTLVPIVDPESGVFLGRKMQALEKTVYNTPAPVWRPID